MQNRPLVKYWWARDKPEPHPDPSLLDPIDSEQYIRVTKPVHSMLQIANDNVIADIWLKLFSSMVHVHQNIHDA